MTFLRTLLRPALGWPVGSQQHARRNALLASTALAQLRQEQREVEEYLALHHRRFELRAGSRRPVPASESSWEGRREVI